MRRGKRTQDFYRAKTSRERLYYSAGIPSSCWGAITDPQQLKFKNARIGDSLVPVKEQRVWFDRMWNGEFFLHPYLMLVISDSNDNIALEIGYDLLKKALESGTYVQVTESSRVAEELEKEDELVFMLTNVYDNLPEERIQNVRDWVYRHEDNFRVICAAGDPTTLVNRLKLKLNAIFYLSSSLTVEKDFS